MITLSIKNKDNNLVCLRKIDYKPNQNCKMHTHESIEIYYFISGDCICFVEGTEYKLKPKDILIIRPLESHTMRWYTEKPYERIVINFPIELLNKYDPEGKILNSLFSRPLGVNNLFTDSDFGHSICSDLFKSIKNNMNIENIISRAIFVLAEANYITEHKELQTRPTDIATKMIDYVNFKLSSPISLENISREFFISRSQVNRIFKRHTGSTLMQYVSTKRLFIARTKIRSGEPATVVANECGYTDYTTFYRAYVKQFGKSPQKDK